MYYINIIPGKAAAERGYARDPKDFPHLKPGQKFVAWRVGDDWEIESTLPREELIARIKALEKDEKNMEGTYAMKI